MMADERPPIPELSLINAARRGDAAAWETLVRAHQEAIFRLAYLLLRDRSEAEDMAQETFLRAFRALERFDAERPLRPWLLQITTNLVRNRQRSVGRYWAAVRRLWQTMPTVEPAISDQGMAHWEAQTLWAAVGRLRAVDQEILYLRYFLDLSEADMARVLVIAPGTVKSRLSRALARLRSVVAGEFPALGEQS